MNEQVPGIIANTILAGWRHKFVAEFCGKPAPKNPFHFLEENSEQKSAQEGPFLMYSQQEPTSAVATTAQSSIRGPAKSPPITIDGSRTATL